MKNKNLLLVIGQFSLAASILLNHFVQENGYISFIIGVLTGMSLVLNLAYLMKLRKEN